MIPNTIQETRIAILHGNLTLTQLVEHYFEQISTKNEEINAYVYTDKNSALKQAKEIQKKVDNGTHGALLGAIMGIKDVICESAKPTTCASEMLAGFESVYDATVIERLKAQDAILIGRLNMDEFAMGSTNEYSRYGAARNPFDSSKVTGGSSGGSAAAVGSDMANCTLGSDTGGSIRQPASYCGVVGIKPTYGRVSRYGLVAFASSFDSIGPLAHTVYDAASVLQTIAGFDARDNTSAHIYVPNYIHVAENPNYNIKIGVPEEFFGEGLDNGVKLTVVNTIKKLEKYGAEVVPIHLPHTKYGLATYYILATAEASSNLARFDGIRYGHRTDKNKVFHELKAEEANIKLKIKNADDEDILALEKELSQLDSALTRLYKKSRTEGFGLEVKRRIMLGTYVLSAGYYDAYYGKAQRVRRLIQKDYKEAFQKVDVIACPTAPTTAFDIGSEINDPLQMYLNDAYTITANLAGICAISVPAGMHENGLPVGIQFLGDLFQEEKIINAARLVELLR